MRSLDTVILDDNIKEVLTSDIKEFLGNKEWYFKRGSTLFISSSL
jgi:hypothetical protein